MRIASLSAVLCLGLLLFLAGAAQAKVTAGLLEPALLKDSGLVVAAKLDTGARICSLHATDIKKFTRDGSRWVRFTTLDHQEKPVTLEMPLAGHVKVKRHFGKFQRRPLVMLTICLGGASREVEVNLVDRNHVTGRLLVGRNFMNGLIVVDPELKDLTKPACGTASDK